MKYKEERSRITIEPSNDMEIAYIEEVFGLKKDGDSIELVRKNAMGLSCIAYLETKVKPQQREMAVAWQPSTLAEYLTNSSTPNAAAKLTEDLAYKVYADLSIVQEYSVDEAISCYAADLQAAIAAGNYTRVATLAVLLAQLD